MSDGTPAPYGSSDRSVHLGVRRSTKTPLAFTVMADEGMSGRQQAGVGILHHVELWVPDINRAVAQWGWLLTRLGYESFQEWPSGRSWKLGSTYLVLERSAAMTAGEHERRRPGLNHIAFHAGTREQVDALAEAGPLHGWTLMFPDEHPYAGGSDHYAAYLVNTDGYEVELVAATR
jgi:catechol 2,3-dioxygenase-like lactoylglutathione lyase family enzyme